jgi:hypothetical protein
MFGLNRDNPKVITAAPEIVLKQKIVLNKPK